MSWKRVIYVFIVISVAGISALGGAIAGGIAVYRAMQTGQSGGVGALSPAVEATASNDNG